MIEVVSAAGRRRGGGVPPPELPNYPIPESAPYNAPGYIHIPTYDGSNQAVHPDVIDFAHVLPEGTWRGHRFWMAMTPYPNSIDTFENPSILVSAGGITWAPPPGLTNPVFTKPTVGYNADTELVYDFEADELVMIFLRSGEGVRISRSSDGIEWTPHAPMSLTGGGLSPSVLRDEPLGLWRMWYNTGLQTITAPALEGPWSSPVGCSGAPSSIWHSNVQHAPGGGYHLLAHTAVGVDGVLRAASSPDGITWTTNPTALVTAGTHQWSLSGLYRPALTVHEDGDRYRVWYSGQSVMGAWRIAYTEIPLTEWPAIP